jgi:cell division transport system permease protein
MAFAVYLGALGGVALIAVGDVAHGGDASAAGSMTLQVPADTSGARLNTVLALLRQTRGIAGVRLLEPAETARLVEPWLGSGAATGSLPVPRLVDLHVDGLGTPDLADLRQRLASIVPDARLDGDGTVPTDFQGAMARLSGAIAAAVIVVLAIAILAALSDARTRLMLDRDRVELLHLLGAADDYIARQFEGEALRLGSIGACGGAVAAALTVFGLGSGLGALRFPALASAGAIADWRLWLLLAGAAVVAAGIAVAAARLTILRRLSHMP